VTLGGEGGVDLAAVGRRERQVDAVEVAGAVAAWLVTDPPFGPERGETWCESRRDHRHRSACR